MSATEPEAAPEQAAPAPAFDPPIMVKCDYLSTVPMLTADGPTVIVTMGAGALVVARLAVEPDGVRHLIDTLARNLAELDGMALPAEAGREKLFVANRPLSRRERREADRAMRKG